MSTLFTLSTTSSRLAYNAQPLSDIERRILVFDAPSFPLPLSLSVDFDVLDGSFLRLRSLAKKFCDFASRDDDDEVFCARRRGSEVVESSWPVSATSVCPRSVGFRTWAYSWRSVATSSFDRPLTSAWRPTGTCRSWFVLPDCSLRSGFVTSLPLRRSGSAVRLTAGWIPLWAAWVVSRRPVSGDGRTSRSTAARTALDVLVVMSPSRAHLRPADSWSLARMSSRRDARRPVSVVIAVQLRSDPNNCGLYITSAISRGQRDASCTDRVRVLSTLLCKHVLRLRGQTNSSITPTM